MEIIIILVFVVLVVLLWNVSRRPEPTTTEAPYKVETPVVTPTVVPPEPLYIPSLADISKAAETVAEPVATTKKPRAKKVAVVTPKAPVKKTATTRAKPRAKKSV